MDIVIIDIAFITQFFPFELNGRNHIAETSLVVQWLRLLAMQGF